MNTGTPNAAISCRHQRVLIDGESDDSGREISERQEFGKWWRDWADPRACNTTFIQEIAFEAWKAARKGNV